MKAAQAGGELSTLPINGSQLNVPNGMAATDDLEEDEDGDVTPATNSLKTVFSKHPITNLTSYI